MERVAGQLADPLFDERQLLSPEDLTADERQMVPRWWLEAATLPAADAAEFVIAQWNSVLPGRLPATLELFRRRAAGVYLTRVDDGAVVLVYALHDETGDPDQFPFVCWYGHPPRRHLVNPRVDLELLPRGIRAMYSEIHDHFYLAPFESTGFMPSKEIFRLDGDPGRWKYENTNGTGIPDSNNMIPIVLHDTGSVCIELAGDRNEDDITGWLLYEASLVFAGPMWDAIDQRLVELCRLGVDELGDPPHDVRVR